MQWILYSVLTAFLWGLCYTGAEQTIKRIDKSSYIVFSCLFSLLIYGIMSRTHIAKDFAEISNVTTFKWLALTILSGSAASYISMLAIQASNASLAAALEITYPFWCMLFAWYLFGHTLSVMSICGAVIMFAGIIVVIIGKT